MRIEALSIDETVIHEVPELLDEETIAAVKEKIRRNKSVDRNPIKNRYLLNGLTFCGNCGYSVSGVTNTNKKNSFSYYTYSYKRQLTV